MAQDKGQRAAVVGFGVVGYDHVDLVGLYDGADAFEHFFCRTLDGIDERDLFVENEIGVVRGAFFRFVPVEIAHVPVYGSHPVNVFGYSQCFHKNLLDPCFRVHYIIWIENFRVAFATSDYIIHILRKECKSKGIFHAKKYAKGQKRGANGRKNH